MVCIAPCYWALYREAVLKCPCGCRGTSSLLPSPPIHLLIKLNICSRKRRKKVGEAKVFLPFCSQSFLCLLKLSRGEEHCKGSCLVASPAFSAPLLFPAVPLLSCISFVALHPSPWSSLVSALCARLVHSECLFSSSLYRYHQMCYPVPKHVVSASALATAGWMQARYHTLMWAWRLLQICHLKFVCETAWKGS